MKVILLHGYSCLAEADNVSVEAIPIFEEGVRKVFGDNIEILPVKVTDDADFSGLDRFDPINNPIVICPATGGTEHSSLRAVAKLTSGVDDSALLPPILVLSYGMRNSLAASSDISYALRLGRTGRVLTSRVILTNDAPGLAAFGNDWQKSANVVTRLSALKFGLLGRISSWLVCEPPAVEILSNRAALGGLAPAEQITSNELCREYDTVSAAAGRAAMEPYLARAAGVREPSPREIDNAGRATVALQRIAERRGLSAITLGCFDLIKPLDNTTLCAAAAIMNTEMRCVVACEGETGAMVGMALAAHVLPPTLARPVFMANPAVAHGSRDLVLAHCTMHLPEGWAFEVRSHYETLSSVAFRVRWPEGTRVTVFKLRPAERRAAFATGTVTWSVLDSAMGDLEDMGLKPGVCDGKCAPASECVCRTQLRVKFDADAARTSLLSLGNHQLVAEDPDGTVGAALADICRNALGYAVESH